MWKKLSSLFFFALLGISAWPGEVQAQTFRNIDFVNDNNPATAFSVCQCDTLGTTIPPQGNTPDRIPYNINAAQPPSSNWFYELSPPSPTSIYDFSSPTFLQLWDLVDVPDGPGTTVQPHTLGTKYAGLIIPCDAVLGVRALRVRNNTGEISDTVFINVNRLPEKPQITAINGGFENPYTNADDWGFCQGDSIQLVGERQPGGSYQWLNGGAPIAGETSDTLWVKQSGAYSFRVDVGACARDSKDTLINAFLPPTDITLNSSPPRAFQIDNPIPTNMSPDDSVQFCANSSAVLMANPPLPSTGLTFSYTWITDSIDAFGDTTFYMLDQGDTNQLFTVDTTGRYYVVIDDGFCVDTSAPYYAYEDPIPNTDLQTAIYRNGVLEPWTSDMEVCMKDSIMIRSANTEVNWEYQWQRLTATNNWRDLPDAQNPNVEGNLRSIQVDTSIKPIQTISTYRLKITTVTPQGDAVCEEFSDPVEVRWFPEYQLTYQADPWVMNVGQDSINFCATDSAVIQAPQPPGDLIYTYQWMRDSLDTALGAFVKVDITGEVARGLEVKEEGRYYVVLDDGYCNDTSHAFNVFVDTLPSTSVVNVPYPGQTNTDRLLCLTDSVMLTAMDTVIPPPASEEWNYAWQYNYGAGWQSLTNDTLPYLSVDTAYRVNAADTVYFRLRIDYENDFGNTICPFITDSIEVVFFRPPNLSFSPSDSVLLCEGDSVSVAAQGNSNTYTWSDGAIGAQRWFSEPGTYTVTGTGQNQCTTTRQVKVTYYQTQANAGPDITTTSGSTVTLNGSGGQNFRWFAEKPIAWSDFLSSSVDVSYTLPEGLSQDTITIYLEVTNDDGCRDLDSLELIVTSAGNPNLELIDRAWNLFTPNNDGVNDVWDISSIVNERNNCRITIMNRWGSTVYEEENFDGIWEGNDSGGNELPDGTYYYVLSCDDQVLLKKAVTLIRNN